jgi:hypothetical protein
MTWYDRIEAWDNLFPTPLDWYAARIRQADLRIASPSLDGTNSQLVAVDMSDVIAKAQLATADTGAANPVYDLGVFVQYKTLANTFGALPSETWRRLGYRAASTASSTSGLGVAEGGALGTPLEATFTEVAPVPKEIELVHDYTQRLIYYEAMADAVSLADNRQVAELDFFKSLNADLHVDGDTLAGNNFESIDRVTASSGEATGLAWTAGDEDLYSIDRSANTWFDANSDHNSGVDRNLTEALITALRRDAEPFWSSFPENKVFITGYDTWDTWSQLLGASQRLGAEWATIGVNGVDTSPGVKTGFKIATFDEVPVIRDDNVTVDTISRIYLLDTEHVGIAWAKPPYYLETDPETSDVFAVGHVVRGVRYGVGELYTTKPVAQSKLRDLQ